MMSDKTLTVSILGVLIAFMAWQFPVSNNKSAKYIHTKNNSKPVEKSEKINESSASYDEFVITQNNNKTTNEIINQLLLIYNKYYIVIFFSIISGIFTGLLVFFIQKRQLNKLFKNIRIPKGHKKNTIMIVGLKSSGKTTTINMLSRQMNISNVEETKDFSILHSKTDGTDGKYQIFISDYRGDDIGNLIRSFIIQQLQLNTPMRFGNIDSLVFVVDLFPPINNDCNEVKINKGSMNNFCKDRIQEHIEQWNKTALDAVFGMNETSSLKYICLFINKLDLISDHSQKMRERITDEYRVLIDSLRKRQFYCDENGTLHQYADFRLIIGSALEGDGTLQLKKDIFNYSKPLSFGLQKKLGLKFE